MEQKINKNKFEMAPEQFRHRLIGHNSKEGTTGIHRDYGRWADVQIDSRAGTQARQVQAGTGPVAPANGGNVPLQMQLSRQEQPTVQKLIECDRAIATREGAHRKPMDGTRCGKEKERQEAQAPKAQKRKGWTGLPGRQTPFRLQGWSGAVIQRKEAARLEEEARIARISRASSVTNGCNSTYGVLPNYQAQLGT